MFTSLLTLLVKIIFVVILREENKVTFIVSEKKFNNQFLIDKF